MKFEEIKYIVDTVNDKFSIKFTDDKTVAENKYDDITVLFDEDNKIIGVDIGNLNKHISSLTENIGKAVVKSFTQKLIK